MSFDKIDLQWFAAEDEGRTEAPSEYKLRKAREEGRIAKSSELNGSLVFFFSLLNLIRLKIRGDIFTKCKLLSIILLLIPPLIISSLLSL